jgi:hypothetical protein
MVRNAQLIAPGVAELMAKNPPLCIHRGSSTGTEQSISPGLESRCVCLDWGYAFDFAFKDTDLWHLSGN